MHSFAAPFGTEICFICCEYLPRPIQARGDASNFCVQQFATARRDGTRREIENRRQSHDSPDRLGITLSWHRNGGYVEIALRKTPKERCRHRQWKFQLASNGFGTAAMANAASSETRKKICLSPPERKRMACDGQREPVAFRISRSISVGNSNMSPDRPADS
jgi:hypothetical protein